jgi:hypothetical protein
MICFSVLQVPMMGTAEEMKELISKGTFMAFENRVPKRNKLAEKISQKNPEYMLNYSLPYSCS